MAAGLPVVASRTGGIPETVGENIGGILLQPGDGEVLAQAMIKLIKDPGIRFRMGRAGRQRAERLFAAEIVAEKMVEVYRSVALSQA